VTIDLGDFYIVNDIDLFFVPLRSGWNGYNSYNAYYGNDNSNWTKFGNGVFVDCDPTQLEDNYSFGAIGQSMRYVKYEVVGGSHWASINEISVRADDAKPGSPIPEPVTMFLLGTGLIGFAGYKLRKQKHH